MVGHHGIRGAEGHDQLAAALFEGAQVGILRVEIRRERGGVGIDVRAEIDFLQRLVGAKDPLEEIQVPVRGLDGTAERNAIEDAFASHGMARSVEEFAQRRGVFVGKRHVLFPRQRDHRLDVLGTAARVGDELTRRCRYFARRHEFIRGRDDAGVLRLGEGTLLQELIVPQEVGVQRRAAMRGDARGDAVVILGITLRLLQRLLTAGRTAAEIGKLRILPIIGAHDLLARERHEVRGAEAEILPHFPIADTGVGVRRGAHVSRRHRETRGARPREAAGVDAPGGAAVAEAKKAGVPFFGVGQPGFDVDVRALRGIEHELHDGPRPRRVALYLRDRRSVDLQRAQRGQLFITRRRRLGPAKGREVTEQRGCAEECDLGVHGGAETLAESVGTSGASSIKR